MENNSKMHLKTMKNIFILAVVSILMFAQCSDPAGLNALLITDQNGESSENIKTILENTGLFNVETAQMSSTDFEGYDVVVLQINNGNLDESTKSSYEDYVNKGGGIVVLGEAVKNLPEDLGNPSAGKSSETYNYLVSNVNVNHPITKGLHQQWLHNSDYLLYNTAGIDGKVDVLSIANADTIHGGSGKNIPVLFTVQSGEGRVFVSTLGNNAENSMSCVGFITTLQRGAEWAATGTVSQEVPLDFPSSVSSHTWPAFQPLSLDELFEKASTYQIGNSKKYLSDISTRIRSCDGKKETYAMYEDKILNFLQSNATVDSKTYLCHELSWIGSDKSKSVLEKLTGDKDLSDAASYALQRLNF